MVKYMELYMNERKKRELLGEENLGMRKPLLIGVRVYQEGVDAYWR